jgi:hypothetical protein
VGVSITLRPYHLPTTASASKATRSNIGRNKGNRNYPKSTQNPRSSDSRDVFPPQTSHGRQPLHPVKILVLCLASGRWQLWYIGLESVDQTCGRYSFFLTVHLIVLPKSLLYYFVLYIFILLLTHFRPRQCPMLRVQFVASYWPDLVYNVRRVRSRASLFSRHTGRGTTCRLPPPHLKLYERVGRGEFGQVLDGTVSVPQSRVKRNVVANLFLRAHLDKLYNENHLYRTRLVGLRNKAVPKVFGAFVIRGSKAAAETMEKWGVIMMEKCGSAVQSVDELTVDQR